jgi:hypothetical protein
LFKDFMFEVVDMMQWNSLNIMPGLVFEGALPDGAEKVHAMRGLPIPCRVWVEPAAGDTVAVEYSYNNGKTWKPWANGPVTVNAEDGLDLGVTHLKFQRTAGEGVTSAYGVC